MAGEKKKSPIPKLNNWRARSRNTTRRNVTQKTASREKKKTTDVYPSRKSNRCCVHVDHAAYVVSNGHVNSTRFNTRSVVSGERTRVRYEPREQIYRSRATSERLSRANEIATTTITLYIVGAPEAVSRNARANGAVSRIRSETIFASDACAENKKTCCYPPVVARRRG